MRYAIALMLKCEYKRGTLFRKSRLVLFVGRMLRVLFVITELEVGGAESCLVKLATQLDRNQFEVRVCSIGSRPRDEKAALVEILERACVPVHFLNADTKWDYFRARRGLTRLLQEHPADVVQSFLFHANTLTPAVARRAGVRRIFTAVRVADPPRWRLAWERRASRSVNRIVCVSESVARFVREVGKFDAGKLVVIPNAVDVESMADTAPAELGQFGIDEASRVLICVGRLHEQKGFDWLIKAAPTLLSALPRHEILIVGDGPQAGALREQSLQLGVGDRVHFAGWRSDACELLAAADGFLLTSRWEGMPNALLEAIAAGLPVVATDVEGVREVLGESSDQQVVPFGDTNALIARAKTIFNHDVDLTDENLSRVKQIFSDAKMVEHYQRLFLGELSGPAE